MTGKDVLQSLKTAPFGSKPRLPVNGSDMGVFARMMRARTDEDLIDMGKSPRILGQNSRGKVIKDNRCRHTRRSAIEIMFDCLKNRRRVVTGGGR
ncbi:MAG: hypothetical protein ACJA1F_000735 [Paracoccaceae bacterium]|jgi:hypothetical protein